MTSTTTRNLWAEFMELEGTAFSYFAGSMAQHLLDQPDVFARMIDEAKAVAS